MLYCFAVNAWNLTACGPGNRRCCIVVRHATIVTELRRKVNSNYSLKMTGGRVFSGEKNCARRDVLFEQQFCFKIRPPRTGFIGTK